MTLTRTRACARSAETWTPVTVTNPTRGSRTLPVRKAATVWRLARRELQLPGHDGDHHGSTALGRAPDVERARHLFDAVGLDQVADLHVVEVLNADAALEALANLAHVVLEALERPDPPFVHLDAVADHPHPRRSGDHPRPAETAGDGAD